MHWHLRINCECSHFINFSFIFYSLYQHSHFCWKSLSFIYSSFYCILGLFLFSVLNLVSIKVPSTRIQKKKRGSNPVSSVCSFSGFEGNSLSAARLSVEKNHQEWIWILHCIKMDDVRGPWKWNQSAVYLYLWQWFGLMGWIFQTKS